MPVLVHSIAAVAAAGSISYVTVPVERVEPIVVNEPITVQVRRCHNIPVYVDPPRHVSSPTNSNVLGGIVGAVIGGGLTKGGGSPLRRSYWGDYWDANEPAARQWVCRWCVFQ